MQRLLLSLLAAVSLSAMAAAGNRLTVSTGSAEPGKELTVAIGLETDEPVAAMELTIPLGDHLRYAAGSCVVAQERITDHQCSASQVGKELRIYIYSLSLSPLQGTGGLLTFRLLTGNKPATYPLVPEVVLSNSAGSPLEATATAGAATILAPELTILTPAIDYGHIPIRSTYTQTLRLQNTGTIPLTVTDITVADAAVPDPCFAPLTKQTVIEPQATQDVELQYRPVARGSIRRTLSVVSDAVNETQRATIAADPFSVNELHTGSAQGRADNTVRIALTMNNMEPIVALQCAFRLPKELVYVQNSVAMNSLRSNGHLALAAMQGDTLRLMAYSPANQPLLQNDGEVLTFDLRLDGNAGYYYLQPTDVILSNITEEDMTSATTDGYVEIQSPRIYSADELTFADSPLPGAAHAAYEVRNHGNAPLQLERATFLSEGFTVEEPFPIQVLPYESTTLHIAYNQQQEGDFASTMHLYTNDPTSRMKAVAVVGHSYAPNELSVAGRAESDRTYRLTLSMDNYSDIAALQCDIVWADEMLPATGSLQPSERLSQHSYSLTKVAAGTWRLVVYSLSNAVITGHSGELLTIPFVPQNDFVYCETAIQVKNIVLSTAQGADKCTVVAATLLAECPQYTLKTCSNHQEWGTTSGDITAVYNTTVEAAATASYGYHFLQWSDGNTDNPRRLTLTQDTVLTAQFAPNQYTLTVLSDNAEQGTAAGGGTADYNTTVEISATAKTGYHFVQWSDGNPSNPRTVTVTGDATYTAQFAANQYTITVATANEAQGTAAGGGTADYNTTVEISATAKTGYHFVQWSDGNPSNPRTVTITGDATYTAQFAANQYTITVATANEAQGTAAGGGTADYNTTVEISATAKTGYHFVQWSDGNPSNPRTVTVTGDATYTAQFAANQYTITVATANEAQGTAAGGGTADYNMTVEISATAKTGYHFVQWSDGNPSNPRTVTITGDATYTAQFAANQYTITVATANAEQGTAAGGGTADYNTTVEISATAKTGYHFVQWSDGNQSNPRTVTVTGDVTYTAQFAANQYTITVATANEAQGTAGGGTADYNTTVEISATAKTGYHFVQWSDGNTENPRNILVSQDATYTAQFAANQYTITVATANEAQGTAAGGGTADYNTTVEISATAKTGYHFVQWSDGNPSNPRSILVSQDETYTAQFAPNQYTLTVLSDNEEQGTVTGGTTADYLTEITITATPAAGYKFVQWSDGNTENPRIVTLTEDTTITALFRKDEQTGLENTTDAPVVEKFVRNNQVLIRRNGRLYTVTGQAIAE